MKIGIFFATATAVSLLLSGGAYAQNKAYLDQQGDDNSGLITQSGENAEAGTSAAGRRILQDGNGNILLIVQASSGRAGTEGLGIDQSGDRNQLSIAQQAGSRVDEVQQSSPTNLAGTSRTNIASVTQTGGDRVFRLHQDYTGSGAANTANRITIDQAPGSAAWGASIGGNKNNNFSNYGGGGVFQTGQSNMMEITQRRTGTQLNWAVQIGDGNSFTLFQGIDHGNLVDRVDQFQADNTANISQRGLNNATNGNSGAVGSFSAGGPAAGVGVSQARAYQDGLRNELDYAATGNLNLFGLRQEGDDNFILATVSGNQNQLAIWQDGDGNSSSVLQSGNLNNAGIDVDGDDNFVNAAQTGTSNQASADILGDGNVLNFRQNGDFNVAAVDIDGNGNNNDVSSPAFSGDALAVRDLVRADPLGTGFRRGDLFQEGDNNILRGATLGSPLTVGGNDNSFATFQKGNGNTIVGAIDGNSNQAVVAQIGNSNIADMSQIGSGNNLGISQ